ncbi:MAG: serine--tRNA ligase, partial [Planctomycetes bacterium]|nr:serine--tRNA ligase [Planctomycetota bacterium]
MLDPKFICDNLARVKQAAALKNCDVNVEEVIRLREQRRAAQTRLDALNQEKNQNSKAFAQAKREGRDVAALRQEGDALGERLKAAEEAARAGDEQLEKLLHWIPNVPGPGVPLGGAEANVAGPVQGRLRAFSFKPKPHWEIGADLGILDLERAAKISGAGFPLYVGLGARLERALISWFLDVHTREQGYTELLPGFLVTRQTMFGTGQLPKLENDMYRCEVDDLFLIPTAEVPVTNVHAGERLEESQLPVKYCAWTPCFRREAGSAGQDTRGITRVHQFNKVELVKLAHPDRSYEELETLRADAEILLARLDLPYRVVTLAAGDMSFAASKCYDLEVHAPGVDRWLEVSSCSNFEDFQARRANIRFRSATDKKLRFVHTLNGSALALPRVVIGIIANYQQADGSVAVPEALRPYLD